MTHWWCALKRFYPLIKQIVRTTIYVPVSILLALNQADMSHNMLRGMDLLTRLRDTLLPEKEAKKKSS